MLSFTDYYNATSIDRLLSKNEIGKDSCYFNKSLLWRSEFSSTTKNLFFLLKTLKNNYSSASDWWENTRSSFKENTRTFSKNSPHKVNFRISRLKKRLWNLYKEENFKQELNQWLKPYKMKWENKQAKSAKLHASIRW